MIYVQQFLLIWFQKETTIINSLIWNEYEMSTLNMESTSQWLDCPGTACDRPRIYANLPEGPTLLLIHAAGGASHRQDEFLNWHEKSKCSGWIDQNVTWEAMLSWYPNLLPARERELLLESGHGRGAGSACYALPAGLDVAAFGSSRLLCSRESTNRQEWDP